MGITKAKDLGIELKSPQSAVSFEDAEEIANYIMTGKSNKLKKPVAKVKKAAPKKEETPTETKTEETKEEEPKVSKPLKSVAPKKIIPKRRGLKIVRKKKPREEAPAPTMENKISSNDSQPKKAMKSLSEILGGNDISDSSKDRSSLSKSKTPVKKKEKKKQPTKSHDHGKVIEFDATPKDNFNSAPDESLLGEEVVLLDMDLAEPSKFLEENKPQNNNNKQSRASKPAAFGNRPQGLKRKKRKKRIKREAEDIEISEVTIPEDVRVYEFAEACGKSPSEVITVLFGLGEEFGIEVTVK